MHCLYLGLFVDSFVIYSSFRTAKREQNGDEDSDSVWRNSSNSTESYTALLYFILSYGVLLLGWDAVCAMADQEYFYQWDV